MRSLELGIQRIISMSGKPPLLRPVWSTVGVTALFHNCCVVVRSFDRRAEALWNRYVNSVGAYVGCQELNATLLWWLCLASCALLCHSVRGVL